MSSAQHLQEAADLVSVVIPVRNVGRYLPRALASVRDQGVARLEVIIVDGGSTDETLELVRAFGPERLIHQSKPGLWPAFNEGLAAARGEFIAFLGGDDYWPPGSLDLRLAFAQAHPETGCVFGQVQLFLEPGLAPPPGFRPALLASPHAIRLLECMLARRSVFESVGAFDEQYPIGADTDWFARAADAGISMNMLAELVVYKRIHAENYMLANPKGSQHDLLRLLRESVARKRPRPSNDPPAKEAHGK